MATVTHQPPAFSPAGNPMYVELTSTAAKVWLRLKIRPSYDAAPETVLLQKVPDANDAVSFRIDHILLSFANNVLPDMASDTIQAESLALSRYVVEYSEDGTSYTALAEKTFLKAAWSHQRFPDRTTTLPTSGRILTHRPSNVRDIMWGDPHWLYYFHDEATDAVDIPLDIRIRYTDGSHHDLPQQLFSPTAYRVYRIPVGDDLKDYRQHHPLREISQVDITITHGSGTESVKLYFYEKQAFGRTYLFFNSLGALETFNGQGLQQKSLSIERDTYRKHQERGYTVSDALIEQRMTLHEKFTGNTGWMVQPTFDWVQELFTSEKVWIMENGQPLPIIIEGDSFDLEGDKRHQFAVSFEYRYAFDRIGK